MASLLQRHHSKGSRSDSQTGWEYGARFAARTGSPRTLHGTRDSSRALRDAITNGFLLGTDGMPHPVGGVVGVTCTCHALINIKHTKRSTRSSLKVSLDTVK